jgi:hypothetical protein
LIVLSVTGDRADGRSQQEPTVDPNIKVTFPST